MSNFLYRTRLQWDGYHGIAKHDGVMIELRSCPQFVAGQRIVSTEYCPDVRVATVQPFDEPHRDMTPAEVTTCRALLERVSIAAREALNR